MAEFVEVMNEMRRMCKHIRMTSSCKKCPINKKWCTSSDLDIRFENAEKFESIINEWASEHTEPKEEP